MNDKIGSYHVIDFPPERRAMPNFLDLSWRKHSIYGLLEVDVTVARASIHSSATRRGHQEAFYGGDIFS